MGTSPRAIMHHYDLSDDFFRIWLGPDMVYSCGWWEAADGGDLLAQAQHPVSYTHLTLPTICSV